MNSEMYGNQYQVPQDVLNSLENHKDETTIKNIFINGYLTYQNMKKILHDIDNGKFGNKDLSSLKSFITLNLGSDRGSIDRQKRDAKDSGMQNQYLSTHRKDNVRNLNRQSKSHHGSFYEEYNREVMESLQRINEIMKQIL
jgi:hypothetical protein